MQTYDVIMLVILGASVLFGFFKGFAWQIASVAAFVVSYFVAANFNGGVAEYFDINPFVAMFGLFILTALGIWIGYGVVHKQIEKLQLKSFDRQIGAIVGMGTGVILCLVVTFFALMMGEGMGRKIVKSRSGKYITKVIQKLEGIMPVELQERVNPYLEKLDTKLNEAQTNVDANPELGDDKSLTETIKESLTEEEIWLKNVEATIKSLDD